MQDEFTLVQTLRGAIYGRVALVRHRATDAIYAMKMMSLAHMAMQRAVSGPEVREDGNTELRVLRRISGNRVMVQQESSEQEPSDSDVDRSSYSVHPLWEAWGKPHHASDGDGSDDHHHLLILHADFVDERANARCLVFDYCPYGELYDQLQKTPSRTLGVETARVFFLQIATAIRFIHAQNIAHRDVSLENVLVDANRQCRLGDFGLSCEYGTMCSGRVGKAFYMAPEVYAWQPGELYNGLKADMWSLGIVLFIMVTGAPPLEVPGEKDARFRVIQSKGIGELLAMWKLDTKLPFELCDLLGILLTVDPEERVDIEGVWMHPWLLEPVDAQALAMEGKFSECMVGVGFEPTEREATGEESEDADVNEAEGDAERREPQEEVEAEAACCVPVVKTKRCRKRIKIAIEDAPIDTVASTLTGRVAGFFGGPAFDADFLASVGLPPQLRHEPPGGGEASPDGTFRPVVEPLSSPMVWPKVGVKAALRSLFPPKEVEDLDEMASDDAEEKRDAEANDSSRVSGRSRRRPRLDSSSSCSSYSSASSASNVNHKRECVAGDQGQDSATSRHQGGVVLCRFCLRWVKADKCNNHVTLPTHTAKSQRGSRSKTRRVCDACFLTISAAFARTTASTGSDGECPWLKGAAHVA